MHYRYVSPETGRPAEGTIVYDDPDNNGGVRIGVVNKEGFVDFDS